MADGSGVQDTARTPYPGLAPGVLGAAGGRGFGDVVEIGLVNNLPDAAMEQAEQQFARLLERAIAPARLRLRLFALPSVPRGPIAQARMATCYADLDDLWNDPPDVVLVTGAEPLAAELGDEAYWPELVRLIDWAEAHAVPLILSCLAAHATVLHLDGIRRNRLPAKRFGVFTHSVLSGHPTTQGMAATLAVSHSRWNEVQARELAAGTYTILTMSDDAGMDMFMRQGRSPMLFFQGHPEYGPGTLLGEYRRDVGRFLRGQQAVYPDLPFGYFRRTAIETLQDFRERALACRSASLLAAFPVLPADAWQQFPEQDAASALVGNWLAQHADIGSRTVVSAWYGF